jgi:predicted metal-dependent phosphoesterase TrpH
MICGSWIGVEAARSAVKIGPVLKVELHAHTQDDPADRIPHSLEQLVERAAAVGFRALAITLHNRYFDPAPHAELARRHNVVLMSGIERSIRGRHILLINFPPEIARVTTLEEIARLKAACRGLVVAPHPFYPTPSALRGWMNTHPDLVDAVEINAMYTRHIDFNRAAVAWAREHKKTVVGNTDLHLLEQIGSTYTLVDAPAEADAICAAIRDGRVEVRTEPLSLARAIVIFSKMCWNGLVGRLEVLAHRPRE